MSAKTVIDTIDQEFRENRSALLRMIASVRALEQKVRDASNSKRASFARKKKLLPWDRVQLLLDPGSPFLALSPLAGLGMYDDDGEQNVLGAGLILGIGRVAGSYVVICANDSAIKGGTSSPAGAQKLIRAQEIALVHKLPFLSLVESGGGNLMYSHLTFAVMGGQRFANQARLSAAGVPQITVVHGNATAGGAYVPGLSDYVIMIPRQSKVFLAGPPLLKAATGEIADDESLGGGELHAFQSGTADYLAANDEQAILLARQVMASLKWEKNTAPAKPRSAKMPRYDIDDLCGIVPADYRRSYDVRDVLLRIVDDSAFVEFKTAFDPYTICAHADIEGFGCGIIGNNGPITAHGAAKAAQFIQLCCQSNTPIVFLQNTTGFIVGRDAETSGIIKHGSKLIQAVTNATVPRITLQIGASFGAGNFAMCGRGLAPNFIFSWPNHRIGVMGGEQAAGVMETIASDRAKTLGKSEDPEIAASRRKKILDHYDATSTALYATARLWDDGIIDPRDSRRVLGLCLTLADEAARRTVCPNTFGVARL